MDDNGWEESREPVVRSLHAMTATLGLPSDSDALVNAGISALVANLVSLVQLGEAAWVFYARQQALFSCPPVCA
jgi:hypothetical protein